MATKSRSAVANPIHSSGGGWGGGWPIYEIVSNPGHLGVIRLDRAELLLEQERLNAV